MCPVYTESLQNGSNPFRNPDFQDPDPLVIDDSWIN